MKRVVFRFTALLCSLLTALTLTLSASADALEAAETAAETAALTEEQTEEITEELIESLMTINHAQLTCTSAAINALHTKMSITADATMAKLGFIDFEIERSYSRTGTWMSTSYTIPDQIDQNTDSFEREKYTVLVTGGYYYRVKATAYAKASGLFGGTQEISVTSAPIWVHSM